MLERIFQLRSIQFSIIAVFLLISGLISVSAEESSSSADYHIRKAKKFVREGREFEAVKEFREALQKDDNRPEIHGYLSIVLYELGFIDDAIEEMRSAVALSPNHAHLNMELGRLYYVKDNTGKAMEQFFSVLEINPGHANAYYYLGELFLRIKAYKMAWLSAKMARRAGHKGQDLISKLSDLSEEPKVEPWNKPGKELYMRQILVNKREKALELLRRIKGGGTLRKHRSKETHRPSR